ncbi:O-methylsterigmatocystin oxidoreductase [Mycena sanguinolenta]|uniref:O-methylsterigmatocystin oxidoreductase n=1 Tax=Mycena sanguinolenta TaxID=230812 RepID=A0A8H7DMP5_9AGAR|nr:O-methylsterigmatocystin oxidoreductase [Mycena sanguinolenta]
MAGAIIIMVTYGHRVCTDNDPFIQLAEDVRRTSEETPGAALVDTMPILKYLPSWIAPFKGRALSVRALSVKMREAPFFMAKEQLAAGKADGSDEELIKNCGGVVYSAGADTTATALTNFFLAMALYPDVQRRAHAELNAIVGRGRLPDFEDKGKLPYLSAILKETLRWKAVTPLGVPHCTTEADEYNGWHIPAKTTASQYIGNAPRPKGTDSSRKEPKMPLRTQPEPLSVLVGGRYFAEDSIWMAISNILHVFSIKGPDGGIKQNDIQWSSGLVRYAILTAKKLVRLQF